MAKKDVSQDASLTEEELKKCGSGTPNACFALIMGPGTNGIACGLIAEPQIAQMAGIQLGWRPPPIPPGRNKPICIKEMLGNSTKE
jgi:hypothetical protein